MDFFSSLLAHPDSVTFMLLFVGLFVYTMKTNENRELHYRQTIELLSKSLNECEATKILLTDINKDGKP